MSDTPKFEVIDRRKMKKDEEQDSPSSQPTSAPAAEPETTPSGPHLVDTASEPPAQSASPEESGEEQLPELPAPPSAEELREQESAYEASAQRVEDLIRAQNPSMGAQP